MVKRAVLLGSEAGLLRELAARTGATGADPGAAASALDLDALAADCSAGAEMDLKAIAKRAAQFAEKRVIELVLGQTRWNRKQAAERLRISYKTLLYKINGSGLENGVRT